MLKLELMFELMLVEIMLESFSSVELIFVWSGVNFGFDFFTRGVFCAASELF